MAEHETQSVTLESLRLRVQELEAALASRDNQLAALLARALLHLLLEYGSTPGCLHYVALYLLL